MFLYTVIIELPSAEFTDELLRWLEDDHLQEVCDAGAERAEAVLLDSPDRIVECRYWFASRDAFARYEAGPAEALRADGRDRFGPERGVRMSRTTGDVRLARGS
ncbi:MAG: DUF4286 domain-containing protein [Sandaracinaceae bacterium]